MPRHPSISVIIPTRGRPERLARCLMCLSAQSVGVSAMEVIVVSDGPDDGPLTALPGVNPALNVRFIEAPRWGNAHAKNVGIEAATAPLVLFLNDDVLPAHDCLAAHATAHASLANRGHRAMVMGYSPFVSPRNPTLLDRMVCESSMIFFYDRMIDALGRPTRAGDYDWGYRHAWTLNLSLPREAAVEVGGFRPSIANCCYEDVEFGWRLAKQAGMPVLFQHQAFAPHDHRYTAQAYLDREYRLGYSAHGFAVSAPQCAADLFGRDVLSEAEVAYMRQSVQREARDSERLRAAFLTTQELSPAPGVLGGKLVELAYTQHLPLKRSVFRRGLLAAVDGQPVDGLFHMNDGLFTEPGLCASGSATPAAA